MLVYVKTVYYLLKTVDLCILYHQNRLKFIIENKTSHSIVHQYYLTSMKDIITGSAR